MELLLGVIEIVFSVIVGFIYICIAALAILTIAALLIFMFKEYWKN